MEALEFLAKRGHRLAPPGDPLGVSCDADGPAIGPIRLLVKTDKGFQPRPVGQINDIIRWTFGYPRDCSSWLPGLWAAAHALDRGNLTRAMIATQLLQLPALPPTAAPRAAQALTLFKASPDDPKHPGWPAGTEGGLGGKFRPKEGTPGEDVAREASERLERLALRRLVRERLRHLLFWRALRLGGEAALNIVPFVEEVGDAALTVDLPAAIQDYETLQADARIAKGFAEKGPYTRDELRVDERDQTFPSFDSFKKTDLIKRFGPAGPGYEYHHIVEQSAEGGIPARELNSTRNIVRIPKLLHEEVSAEYSKAPEDKTMGATVRDSLKGKSFDEQWASGIKILRKVGILK